jgi:hypothetical protein
MKIEELSKEEVIMHANLYIEATNASPIIHAKEGGLVYTENLLTDFINYLKQTLS